MLSKRFISSVLAAALVMGSFPVAPLADSGDLVYSVTFDEGGGAYTLENGAVLADGRDGKAVKLYGENQQYVKLADDITEQLTEGYTISVDVYPETEANFARVFDLGTDTTNFAYFTCMGGGVPKYRYKGDDFFSDGVFLNLNEWNNVTITRDTSGEARLFINGNVAATSRSFVQPLSNLGKTDANYLGKSHFENDAYFTGMIDNFEIYDYAFADGDVMRRNGGAVKVTAWYNTLDKYAIASFNEDEDIRAIADIDNFTDKKIKAKLVSAVYDENNNLLYIKESHTTEEFISPEGKRLINEIPANPDARLVKSYIYTTKGGFEQIAEISYGYTDVDPIPEDTWETTIGVHDPSIFKDPKSGVYYVYSTGMIDIFKSEDLIHWTKTTNTLPDLPQCVYDTYKHDKKEEYSNIWAPDMFYDESDTATPYHLTCSYSDEFGKNNSSIILFKAASPEGPWEKGQIIFTSKSDDKELGKVNAIDSNICVDYETGQKYMVYGSFWQGIHIKELNDDGTVKEPDTVGKRIMSRQAGIGGPEGAYVVYSEDTGYYYLFTSFDSLSDTYNIRVARSKNITGPYVDQNGVDVDRFEAEDNTAVGYKLMGSWQFPNGNTYYGPGHCSVLHDGEFGPWYLVHHQRTVKGGIATLNVRYMDWTDDGWPIVDPERYEGGNIIPYDISGDYDIIHIGENTNAMLTSKRLKINSDGSALYDDIVGTWEQYMSASYAEITLGDELLQVFFVTAWDYDNNRPTVQFTGTNQDGIEIWGKKAINTIIYK